MGHGEDGGRGARHGWGCEWCVQVTEAEWYRFLAELEAADGQATVKFLMRRLETAGMVQDAEEAAEGRQDEAQADAYKQQIASLEGELADAEVSSEVAAMPSEAASARRLWYRWHCQADAYKQQIASLEEELADAEAGSKGAAEDAKAEVARLQQQLQDREAELKDARASAAAPVVAAREAQGDVGGVRVEVSSEVAAMPSEAARARRLWYRLDKGGEGKASKQSIVMLHQTGGWRRGMRGRAMMVHAWDVRCVRCVRCVL